MSDIKTRPVRAWQRMLSGRRLDLLNPEPKDIEIEDIAHGLARVARWNGQTQGDHAFSVAEHSILVTDILLILVPDADCSWQMAALLHDAPEYVIGDLISPFKAAIGTNYKVFELKILDAIHLRFGINDAISSELEGMVKRADEIAAYYEAIKLAGFSLDEGAQFFSPPDNGDVRFEDIALAIKVLPVMEAQQAFLDRFHLLLK